ncbi:MAG: hypothetical protein ACK5LC_13730 [Coprobacillaceae bacterium]
MALTLAKENMKDVNLYARLLMGMDLKHEVYQLEDTLALIDQYGYSENTYMLIIARIINMGKHVDDLFLKTSEDLLKVLDEKNQMDLFLNMLLDEMKYLTKRNYDDFDIYYNNCEKAFEYLFEDVSDTFIKHFLKAGDNNKKFSYIKLAKAKHLISIK